MPPVTMLLLLFADVKWLNRITLLKHSAGEKVKLCKVTKPQSVTVQSNIQMSSVWN
jgi:hypothetical protein